MTQVFKAANGIPDPFAAQVRLAQGHPFICKLRIRLQQGHKTGRKGSLPSGRSDAGDPGHGDLHQPQLYPPGYTAFFQQFFQYRRIGIFPFTDILPILAHAPPAGLPVFIYSLLSVHASSLLPVVSGQYTTFFFR
jgi:hypothetical protein